MDCLIDKQVFKVTQVYQKSPEKNLYLSVVTQGSARDQPVKFAVEPGMAKATNLVHAQPGNLFRISADLRFSTFSGKSAAGVPYTSASFTVNQFTLIEPVSLTVVPLK